jgi:hypothetical protein
MPLSLGGIMKNENHEFDCPQNALRLWRLANISRRVGRSTRFNDKSERIGTVDDIVIAPDKAVSYAIIGAGGFLGVAKHDVAIPVNQFKLVDGKFVLAGATKDALKAMPPFEYAR